MGVPACKATSIWDENMISVFLNSTYPWISLNKYHVALANHFVRKQIANDVVEIRKIDSINNYADPCKNADQFWIS